VRILPNQLAHQAVHDLRAKWKGPTPGPFHRLVVKNGSKILLYLPQT